jgi:hypothetical protein
MLKHKRRPSAALVISVIALFVALGGGAYAAAKIDTSDIKGKAVTGAKINGDAIKSSKVKDGKLKGKDLKDETVSESKLGDGAVGSSKLGTLTTRPGTPVNVPGGAGQNAFWIVGTATASCLPNEKLISGTAEWTNESNNNELAIQEIVYSNSTVTVKGANDNGTNRTLLASAHCLAP